MLPKLVSPGSPYAKAQGSGDPAAVASLTRADLLAFRQAWLRPDKAKIFVVSDRPLAEVKAALTAKTVVGVSPIVGGAPVRGMADACLTAIGVETSAEAVGRHYGSPLLDGWLVDTADAGASVPDVTVRAVPFAL